MLKIKKNMKKVLAVVCVFAILICGIPMTASAEIAVPEMSNTYSYSVWEQEGIFWNWEQTAGTPLDWSDYSYISTDHTAIDTTEAKYFEFDVISNVDIAAGAIWLSCATGNLPPRAAYNLSEIKVGENHIVLDLSKTHGMGIYQTETAVWDREKVICLLMHDGYSFDTDVQLVFSNAAFTTDVVVSPAMNNTYDSVYENKGELMSRTFADGAHTMNWAGGWNGIFLEELIGSNTTTDSIDVSKAEYFEFDIYSSANLNNNFSLWLSSSTGADAGRATIETDVLKAGWNHLCLPLASLGGAYGTLDLSSVKTVYFESTIDIADEGVETVTFKMSNIAFTKSYPDIEDRLIYSDTVFENESILFGKTVANGTAWDAVGIWPYINGGEAVDATNADYLELDVYVSTDLAQGGTFWLTSAHATASGRRPAALPPFKAGWNHICYDLDSFVYNVNGEWTELFNRAALKGIFFELTPIAVDTTVENITIKIANFAFTKTPAMKNTYETVDSAEGALHTATLTAGENAYPNNFFTFGKTLSTEGARYIEMDIYASEATDQSFLFWVADNREASTLRAAYPIPVLNQGWNHVVIDVINYINLRDDYELGWGYDMFGVYEFKHPFLEGVPYTADTNGGTLIFANLAVTKDAEFEIGDATTDGKIDMLDIISLKNTLLGGEFAYNKLLDINYDGIVSALDFTALRKILFESF